MSNATPTTIRRATLQDEPRLLELMRGLYASERLRFDEAVVRRMLRELESAHPPGFLYVIAGAAGIVGYILATWGYSTEHGGRYLLVDELFVESAHRRSGLGRAALDFIEQLAREQNVSVVKLEVSDHNPEAARLYLRCGFTDEKRRVLVRRLSSN